MTETIKSIGSGILAGLVVLLGSWMFSPEQAAVGGVYNNVTTDFSEGISVDGSVVIDGTGDVVGDVEPSSVLYPNQTITATTDTLTSADFGETIFLNTASGTTITLPAATAGGYLRFVLVTLFDTANIILDSAEGDNIEGTLHVNGGLVPCAGEDQINLVSSAETVGDFVDLHSNGTSWYLGATMGSTTGSITCTDPS